MRCGKCGAEIPDDAVFCSECGAPVSRQYEEQPAARCLKCGAPLEADSTFCGACGARVTPEQNYEQNYERHYEQNYEQSYDRNYERNYEQSYDRSYEQNYGRNYDRNYRQDRFERQNYQKQPGRPVTAKSNMALIIAICAFVVVAAAAAGILAYTIISDKKADTPGGSMPVNTPAQYAAAVTAVPAVSTPAPTAPAQNAVVSTPPPPPPQQPQSMSGEYLFPSDIVYIQDGDLQGKTQGEVRLILNEMYARHGYIFTTDYYIQYFSGKSWYTPRTTSQEDCERQFNSVEKANKEFIAQYEAARGWR